MRAIIRGLTDAEFERLYGTEASCLAALVAVRQAAGMPCPRCGNAKSYVYGRRVGCTRCDRRWSITAGTVMADTKLPLTTWFRAMHLMTSTKQCISAVELTRRLGVTYETGWYLHKRLRHAMTHMWTAPSPQGVLQRFDQIVASICPACRCART
jgi:transposase-like protein